MSYKEFRDKVLKENSEEYWFERDILDERKRIIKLLEGKDYRGNGPTFTLDELKRLIKGEHSE